MGVLSGGLPYYATMPALRGILLQCESLGYYFFQQLNQPSQLKCKGFVHSSKEPSHTNRVAMSSKSAHIFHPEELYSRSNVFLH